VVRIPYQTLMRDERYFVYPNSFIPERWTENPELIRDARAFVPFSYGRNSCVGKHFAMNLLHLATAAIVLDFEIILGINYNEERFQDGYRDYQSIILGPCPLRFVRREESAAELLSDEVTWV